tara:strand:+ start:139 stop:306 length:168 start_codon:yes stop_codon:yes gene_type:complete
MILKVDLTTDNEKLKTERDFALEQLEKKINDNFDLRQEVIKLQKKLNIIAPDGKA